MHGNAGELPVGHVDAVAAHALVHVAQVVGTDLVAQATRPGVDEHDDLVFMKAQCLRNRRLEDAVDVLNFQEVVAGAERAHLRQAALLGAIADGGRVGAIDRAAFLAVLQVSAVAVPVLDHPRRAFLEQVLQVFVGNPDLASAPRARRHVVTSRPVYASARRT